MNTPARPFKVPLSLRTFETGDSFSYSNSPSQLWDSKVPMESILLPQYLELPSMAHQALTPQTYLRHSLQPTLSWPHFLSHQARGPMMIIIYPESDCFLPLPPLGLCHHNAPSGWFNNLLTGFLGLPLPLYNSLSTTLHPSPCSSLTGLVAIPLTFEAVSYLGVTPSCREAFLPDIHVSHSFTFIKPLF